MNSGFRERQLFWHSQRSFSFTFSKVHPSVYKSDGRIKLPDLTVTVFDAHALLIMSNNPKLQTMLPRFVMGKMLILCVKTKTDWVYGI